ncbi:MAG TPA: choice-of-anchor C family protein [Phycisphaerae bacterium]|nr:choice-of-anchor C family protein [Phycisphaerae bacterium]
MSRTTILCCLVAISCVTISESAGQNLMKNSSFEEGDYPGGSSALLHEDSTRISEWTVTQGTIEWIGRGLWDPFDGDRSIDLNGNDPGAIAQTVATIPGRNYILSFGMAGNPDGGPAIKKLRVRAGDIISDAFEFDTTAHARDDMGWTRLIWMFEASAETTTVEFLSETQQTCGPALDCVALELVFLDSDSDGTDDLMDNCPGVFNPDQTDGDDDGIGDVCDDPFVASAVSRKWHRAAGGFDVPLPLNCSTTVTEGRLGEPLVLVVTFSRPVAPTDGVLDDEVTVSAGWALTSIDGAELTIEVSELTDATCVQVKMRGLADADGRPLDGSTEMCLALLAGDVNGDGRVNVLDMTRIRNNTGASLTPANFRCDVNGDGRINTLDMTVVRNGIGKQGATCPPPAPGVLSIAEPDGLASAGYKGGPFTPSRMTYTLTNTGGLPIAWTAAKAQAWVTLSKAGGMLAGGASDAVEISINAEANELAAGSYSDTVTFTNTTNGSGDTTRPVSLAVNASPIPPGMVLVPAGEFQMGNALSATGDGASNELPVHTVYLDAFCIDRYEVTKGLWDTVRTWGLSNGYLDLYDGSGKAADHPVQTVNWHDCVKWANARSQKEGRTPCYYTNSGLTTIYKTDQLSPYVNWDANGYRLPTEAEWEKAARGGTAGHRFPWSDSDEIQHARASYYSDSAYSYDNSPTRGCHPTFNTGVYPYTSPVGYFAANGYGLYDMTGNVWEWCNDRYGESYYSSSPTNNPRGPTTGTDDRVIRGGGWSLHAYYCRVAYRSGNLPDSRLFSLGVRLALDLE